MGIAVINVVGMVGTAAVPVIVEALHDITGDFRAGLIFVAIASLAGAVCIAGIHSLRHDIAHTDTAKSIAE